MSTASSPVNSSPTILNTGTGIGTNIPTSAPLTNPITTNKFLSKQEREALLQYTKHFIRKAVQIIVQSRLGDKKPTKSRVYAYNSDWFNLSIKDIAQITSMTKGSLGNVENLFNANSPFCIEISLRTPENQTMILETWCILFNDQLVDPTQKVCYIVYKKMSVVLRSLICITRCTPTYQLSRRQSSDTYVLLYRMYCGEPIVHHLGENYGTAKVGTVGTPIGSIIINLAYRTRLTMTPQNSSHSNEMGIGGIHIKDDHFTPEPYRRHNDSASSPNSQNWQIDNENININNNNNSSNSPPILGKNSRGYSVNNLVYDQQQQQQSSSSSSSLSKRSSSNLNTITEQQISNNDNQDNQLIKSPSSNRHLQSKTQPIPMKSPFILEQQQQLAQKQAYKSSSNNQVGSSGGVGGVGGGGYDLQRQRHSSELNQINDESSTDEYNSSSVASTPDTMYYFKLKSAAFVPSASFSNNYYSTSLGNLNNENEMPPFVALLSNEYPNSINQNDKQQLNLQLQSQNQQINDQQFQQQHHQQQQQQQLAQSPPPPQLSIEYNFQNRHRSETGSEDMMASPCSLPNFKILDNQQQLSNELKPYAASSLVAAVPDDFVFIESKKIAFGLSNAANDLSTFFRACENAPILESLQNEPSLSETLKDLDQQLLMYESKVSEFDELIRSLENS